MYGGSLSFCVRDLVEGKVKFEDVEYVFTNTKVLSPVYYRGYWLNNWACWEKCFSRYREVLWKNNPEACVQMAKKLIMAGKVIQPRLFGFYVPGVQHWFRDYDELRGKIAEFPE